MNEPRLERDLLNVNNVESVLPKQGHCKIMNEPILARSLLNANNAECVLSEQDI